MTIREKNTELRRRAEEIVRGQREEEIFRAETAPSPDEPDALLTKNFEALSPEVITHNGIFYEDMHFIQKPFTRNELAAKVREVLLSRNTPK